MIEIRAARTGDDATLVDIDAATWSESSSPGPAPTGPYSFFDRTRPENVLVAEVEGVVVGYVSITNTIPLPSHEHVLQIDGLAVTPESGRRGIGRRLVAAAVAEAQARGARKLSLRVLGSNQGAQCLYASSGFVVEGVLRAEFRLGGLDVDDTLMARYL